MAGLWPIFAANDTLTVNLGNGDDIFSAASLASTSVALTVNGGNGNEIIVGSQGADTLKRHSVRPAAEDLCRRGR